MTLDELSHAFQSDVNTFDILQDSGVSRTQLGQAIYTEEARIHPLLQTYFKPKDKISSCIELLFFWNLFETDGL